MIDLRKVDFDKFFYTMPTLTPVSIPTYKGKNTWERLVIWWKARRKFRLLSDWEIPVSDDFSILIPAGFMFDGASVPRLMWVGASPFGILMIPALVHDYAYEFNYLILRSHQGDFYDKKVDKKTRKYWDDVFLKMCLDINRVNFVSKIAYFMVRIGGWVGWRSFRKLRP